MFTNLNIGTVIFGVENVKILNQPIETSNSAKCAGFDCETDGISAGPEKRNSRNNKKIEPII